MKLEDPDAGQDAKTATRREAYTRQHTAWDAEGRAYEAAQHAFGDTTETEDYLHDEQAALREGSIELELPHEEATRWIAAIDHERKEFQIDDDEYCDRLTAVFVILRVLQKPNFMS